MMTCTELRRYLSAYLDSELDTSASLEVNSHLDGCADCRDRFDQETRLEGAIRDHLQATPSRPEFWNAVDTALEADQGRLPTPGGWLRPFLALAAGVVAIAGAWMLWQDAGRTGENAPVVDAAEEGLVVAISQRVGDMQREGYANAINGYIAGLNGEQARELVEKKLGPGSALAVQARSEIKGAGAHTFELVGGGTSFVDGKEIPVLHYRCCNKDVCVFFMIPASMKNFPEAVAQLKRCGALGCDTTTAGKVSIRECPVSGHVIGVCGSNCAPVMSTAILQR